MKVPSNITIDLRNMEAGSGWHDDFKRKIRKTLDGLPVEINCDQQPRSLVIQYDPERHFHSFLAIYPETGEVVYRGVEKLGRWWRHRSTFCPPREEGHQPFLGVYDRRTEFFVALYAKPLANPDAKQP